MNAIFVFIAHSFCPCSLSPPSEAQYVGSFSQICLEGRNRRYVIFTSVKRSGCLFWYWLWTIREEWLWHYSVSCRVRWVKSGSFPISPAYLVTKIGCKGNAVRKCDTVRFYPKDKGQFTFAAHIPSWLIFLRGVTTQQQQQEDSQFWFCAYWLYVIKTARVSVQKGSDYFPNSFPQVLFMCSDCLPLSNTACSELKTAEKSREEKVKNL